ncbi:VCBS repeat-containing protein [Lentiprolixibacter aurantiacus]|uniref:VCBS repeat-containing protein n=1 Tax=Lentiprolixibacter aurantiacus TaxID=2993939 RepID=A0AAE3MIR1_9FLAO|nr:VCBS repeat-containing protein [Lentiprolixibacter aurantiacus]MCX2718174.1 VCBS repeat-containing protein [Lentiprolixibacter aurantiacus]
MNKFIALFCLVMVLISCSGDGELFHNPDASETGIDFKNVLTPREDLNILDYLYFYNGGGTAIGDINGDGLPDIYLAGNQVKNKLYLNKGNLEFEDITEQAGVAGNSSWNTGAIMGDVNGDGLLDIYVCAVVGIKGFSGYNELFINNGDNTFTESAARYGLDFDSYSSSAAFLDYDLDGDLDLYLLNHAVHTEESYGRANLRYKRNYETGDKLLRNDGESFTDVSEEAGIFGGIIGYGLGVAVSDFNQDGYPDIYVGNDFHEDDYYYLNNGDGTFTESLKKFFGHTTRFSMGNDVADVNHDGWPDLISLDMLPEEEEILKTSEGDDNVQTQRMRIDRFGYHYQFSRNMLQLNRPGSFYAETALQSGIAASDWSWSALFADYDQDGEQDLFISNGIPKRPNDLDYIRFVSSEEIRSKINNTRLVDQDALEMMPSGAVHNYYFRGKGASFENLSETMLRKDTLVSGATAYADLDLDGDLDLVTNNLNREASLYINQTNNKANYLKIKFNYPGPNKFGIGTKVFSYHKGLLQYKELYPVRGFQASSEPIIHFGYGQTDVVDSLKIVWPDGTFQVVKNAKVNQTLKLSPENTLKFDYASLLPQQGNRFKQVTDNLGIDYEHVEDNYVDFNRQKLIPYQISDRGPAVASGDLNGDGKDDLYFGGSKYHSAQIYLQTDTAFVSSSYPELVRDSVIEEISAVIEDFNSDGKKDLFLGTGGGDFFGQSTRLLDRLFIQGESGFNQAQVPEYFEHAAVIKPHDIDGDGDLDLFVGNYTRTNDFGAIPPSYLLRNEGGVFQIVDNLSLQKLGLVTDAYWADLDNDQKEELIVVGEWMAPRFFKNDKGSLTEVELLEQEISGLWQAVIPNDIDGDGDLDLILGNWGNNNKFRASQSNPLKMYYGDFDSNGSTETIIAIPKDGKYYPLESLEGLSQQIVSLRKKFTTFRSMAGKSVEEILDKKTLKEASLFQVSELRSGILMNNEGKFSFTPFGQELQVAPITSFVSYDFDQDGKEEVLAGGNYFGVKPYHGRFGSFSGAMIAGENDVILGHEMGMDFSQKAVRHLHIIHMNDQPYILVTFNNGKAEVYQWLN